MKVIVKITQSCLTLCDPVDYMVHGILQARMLEWVAFLSPADLPNPGIEPRSPTLQVDSSPVEPQGKLIIEICNSSNVRSTPCNFRKSDRLALGFPP